MVYADRLARAALLVTGLPPNNDVQTGITTMSLSKRLLVLALGACLAAPALAQESLVEVYERALANDPAIREAEATYLANAEVKPQARSALLPGLTFGAARAHRFQDTEGGALDPTGQPTLRGRCPRGRPPDG